MAGKGPVSVPMLNEIEAVLRSVMSSDGSQRSRGEEFLQGALRTNASQLLCTLIVLLQQSSSDEVKQITSVLTRQYVQRESVWSSLTAESKEFLRKTMLEIVGSPMPPSLAHKCSDLFGFIAVKDHAEWTDLFPTLIAMASSAETQHLEIVLHAIGLLAEYQLESLYGQMVQMKPILASALQQSNARVQVEAVQALCSVLLSVPDSEFVHLIDLTPALFGAIVPGSEAFVMDDEAMHDALAALVNLATAKPGFFKPNMEQVIRAMFGVAASQVESGTKRLVLEFICVLAENGKGIVRKVESFPSNAVSLSMQFALDIDTDVDWEVEENDADQENHTAGLDALARLVAAIGPKTFFQVSLPFIQELVQDAAWGKRYVGLLVLYRAIESCPQAVSDTSFFGEVLQLAVSRMDDADIHVQYASIRIMLSLCDAFPVRRDRGVSQEFFPRLLRILEQAQSPRLMKTAFDAIAQYCNENTVDSIREFIEPVLAAVVRILQSNQVSLQESAVTALSSIAGICDDVFADYYEAFMPGLKGILDNYTDVTYALLRGKTMECIAFIGSAVGKERFSADAREVMQKLLRLKHIDDVQYSYLHMAFARIAQVLEDDFLPYLDMVIPPLLASAQLDAGFAIEEIAGHPETTQEGACQVDVKIRGVGDRRITINSSNLQEKAVACNMLYQYATDLKGGFFKYVQPVADIVVPLVKYPYNEQVRVAAVATVPALMTAASEALEGEPGRSPYLQELFDVMLPALVDAAEVESDLYAMSDILVSISEVMTEFGGPPNAQQVDSLFRFFHTVLTESLERQHMRKRLETEDGYDEVEKGQLEDENETEIQVIGLIVDCVSQCIKTNAPNAIGCFHQSMYQHMVVMMEPGNIAGVRASAMCIFDEIIEFGGTEGAQYIPMYLPIALENTLCSDVDVRQSASFGVGVCAQYGHSTFAPVLQDALRRLHQVISAPNAREEEQGPATDNAISAFARILLTHNVDMAQLLPLWLSWLPTHHDEDESVAIHRMFCELAARHSTIVLDSEPSRLQHVLRILGTTIDSDLVDQETEDSMKQMWVSMQTLPKEQLAAAMTSLSPDVASNLENLMQG